MIIVRVELHSAITRKVTEIARFDIWNVGGTHSRGDYECASFVGRDREALYRRKVNRRGAIRGHPRLSQHVLYLVAKALSAMGYGEPLGRTGLSAPRRPPMAREPK